MVFQLHPQLAKDCLSVGKLGLCQLLLMNDSQFPWFILVPEVFDITEIYQLGMEHRQQLIEESSLLAKALQDIYQADKLNIAAIGNLVPQLHVHHVVRYRHDKAWPAPVWGKLPVTPYMESESITVIRRISTALGWS